MSVSTFRRTYELTVDGEEVKVTTRPADFLGAERDMTLEHIQNAAETAPMHLQTRVVWRAWRREFPGAPAAHDFPKFLEVLEEMDSVDGEQGEPLTPTQAAESGSSP